ncbi:hypothetical protein HYALB_00012844 [Hymenoscyphus albidus]|uniref:N-acetyltransferase domain-containing protein n=1 Tax=Hymenoscyphus albidus TaxID=595503 RepID=A0A9N9LS36_9HELO|nr:hypothetical protein HYALB_00012844 [Hymenoscyphus albidus]
MSSKAQKNGLKVEYIKIPNDINEYATAYWSSWANPVQATGKLTFPHLGENTPTELEALEAFKRELHKTLHGDENDHWVKVVDPEEKKIVAGARWLIYPENPYRGPYKKPQVTQFAEGSERRELAESMYEQLLVHRPRMMPISHACGLALWILPEHRDRGIGDLILEFFVGLVDEKGLESYLEGTIMGTKLYQRWGFVTMSQVRLSFEKEDPSQEWKEIASELESEPVNIMWRPRGGVYKGGKTVIPWEGEPRKAKL